jgi:uncharacterized membrane protein YhaH (DUF805 family)
MGGDRPAEIPALLDAKGTNRVTRQPTLLHLALPTYLLLGVVAVALAGCLDNPYLTHVRSLPPPHPYPLRGVLWVMAMMSVHTAAAMAILRLHSWRRSWGRALAATGLSTILLLIAALASMHSPPHHTAYLLWLLLMVAALSVLTASSSVAAWRLSSPLRHL